MSERTKAWLSALALVLIFGWTSNMDYTYQLEQEIATLNIKNAGCRGVKVGMMGVMK